MTSSTVTTESERSGGLRRFARKSGWISLFVASATAGSLALAPTASAETNSLQPNKVTCGIATCTAYWSVDRTRELQAEWKDTIANLGDVATAAGPAGAAVGILGSGAAATAGTVTAVIALPIALRTLEFEHMINGAANDNRCLIYKFPGPMPEKGWFGSVSLNNANCDQGPA